MDNCPVNNIPNTIVKAYESEGSATTKCQRGPFVALFYVWVIRIRAFNNNIHFRLITSDCLVCKVYLFKFFPVP